MGRLEVITGPMFSGKTEELMRRLRRAEIAGKKVIVAKPEIDGRYSKNKVVSHNGSSMTAVVVDSPGDLRLKAFGYDVVGVDEGQFFTQDDFPDYLALMSERQVVIVSGLDLTFQRVPFGHIPTLLALADRIDKYSAVCHSCGKDATLTQRLLNGKPVDEGPTIQVGGVESYEARCRSCFGR